MSFQGKLIIDEESEHDFMNVRFSINQPIGSNGRPNGNPTGGLIYLSVACSDVNNTFWAWAIQPNTTKNGSIKYISDQGNPSRIIKFHNAFCVDYEETFNSLDSSPITMYLVLSAEKLDNGTDALNNNWGAIDGKL